MKEDISTLHKPDILTLLRQCVSRSCQRKIEMSGFLRDRNVRLQGWSGGGMSLFFLPLFLAFGLARTLAAKEG